MKRLSARLKMPQRQLHLRLVLATIHFQQVAQFLAHLAQATIHFQQVAQFLAHLNVHKEPERHVQEWRDLVQVQYAQDLQHDQVHHAQAHHLQVQDFHHAQVVHHLLLHINQILQVLAVQLPVDRNVQVVVVHHNAVALVEHLEKMQARNQVVNKSLVRRCAMSSTICRHHNLVAQLFLMVMAKHLFVCVAVPHWQTLQTRSVQIQQR
jgi:hypothetical protein